MNTFQPSKKPINNEKIVVSVRMDISRINKIDEIASKIDISRNELINQCVEYALNNLEFKDNKGKKKTISHY